MVKIFTPTNIEESRIEIIRSAIEVARYNLDIEIAEYPQDTRATDAIASGQNTREMVSRLMAHGYTQDEVQVFIVNKDVRTEELSWCFGATHGKIIIVSDYRIWNTVFTTEQKKAMLIYLIEHEIGHAYNAADDIRAEGIYDMHCTDPSCVMQQVPNLASLRDKSKKVFICREKGCFCPHCEARFRHFSRR